MTDRAPRPTDPVSDRASRGSSGDGGTGATRVGHRRRIALVEPYLGGSHRAWANGFAAHTEHEVEVFGLPAAHWKWRMHGAHVTLAQQLADSVAAHGPFDAVLVSSMTNLPALLGLARDAVAAAPVVLYVHENQLTFPWSPDDRLDLTYAMLNWTSMVAADRVVFNSEYHRRAWFDALPGFLARFPDHRHTALVDAVAARADVLPVGVDLAPLDDVERVRTDRPIVLWNHRWEYDQGPTAFVEAIAVLVDEGLEFDVAVAGERPADAPEDLQRLRRLLGDRLVHDGFADPATYRRLLRRADVVVSTAEHEFFGVAITEAVYAGACPVLPNRLVYPERIPAGHHADCLYDDGAGLVAMLRHRLGDRRAAQAVADALRPVMAACDWPVVAPEYDRMLAGVGRVTPSAGRRGR